MADINILIADDEERMRKLVADFLKKQGYLVFEAENGEKALELFKSETVQFDLLVLDIMMPYMDGISLCREIRKTSSVPIIILTAREQETDELMGFNAGADEYITKPFSPMILVARIQAILRRTALKQKDKLSFDGLDIDGTGHVVTVEGAAIELSPKEFELLGYLAGNPGIALSRNKILSAVWDYDYFGDARTVDTHIKKLREKLGSKGDYIRTIRGVGYKFEVSI